MATRRRSARLCGRDGSARLAFASRSGNQCAALLDDRDRRHAGRAGDGPLTRRSCRRNAAPARPTGRCACRGGAAHGRQNRKFRSRQLVRRHGETAMTALRIRARDLMTEQEHIEVRTRSTWKSVALIAHAWTLILGSIAMVAVWHNPLTFVLAVAIIGSRQLGLSILMHDRAPRCLANGGKFNIALSQWLCAYPGFAQTHAHPPHPFH